MKGSALLSSDICDLFNLWNDHSKADLPDEDWKSLPGLRAWGNSASADLSSPWYGPTIPNHEGNCFSSHRDCGQVGIESVPHAEMFDSRRFAVKERGTFIESKSRNEVVYTSVNVQIWIAERIATWHAWGFSTSFGARQSIQYFSEVKGRGKYKNKKAHTKSFLSVFGSSYLKHNWRKLGMKLLSFVFVMHLFFGIYSSQWCGNNVI